MIKTFTAHTYFQIVSLLVLIQALFWLPSCSKPEIIPSYIHIDSIGLTTSPGVDGSNSHNISDAWVYVDNQLVGAFELPATIPIPYTGNHNLQVLGGIKKNGSTAEREAYPFYTQWTKAMNLVPESKFSVKPVVAYTSYSHPFVWMENFDSPGISLIDSIQSDTILIKDSLNPFEGHYSGSAYLDGKAGKVSGSTHTHFQCQTTQSFVHNSVSEVVYMEINYRCNTKFFVGLVNTSDYSATQFVFFNPTTTWKKMYVRLSDALVGVPIGYSYLIYLGMVKDPLLDVSEMHIDNIKLIH
ncbi:MAG TPA: hypothetical protein VGO45_04970 [Bacteroidia bacterium]|jgi:hypothetical protein|nr:hypothetical protein [Bacteroidia bacterium]